MNCPNKASYFCKNGWGRSVAQVGQVEGTVVSDILLEPGCTCTMFRGDLVPEESLLPREVLYSALMGTQSCTHWRGSGLT